MQEDIPIKSYRRDQPDDGAGKSRMTTPSNVSIAVQAGESQAA